jgi:GNAT superfamily N-acetyltransferase
MALAKFVVVDPAEAQARNALLAYLSEVQARIEGPVVDPAEADDVAAFSAPTGAFLLVLDEDAVVGCGAVRTLSAGVGEIKRMWIRPTHRGRGLGGKLLEALETRSRELGHAVVRLDTNRSLVEALELYRTRGYRAVPPYNDNPDATHWFERSL